jgi:hypothetical protein
MERDRVNQTSVLQGKFGFRGHPEGWGTEEVPEGEGKEVLGQKEAR